MHMILNVMFSVNVYIGNKHLCLKNPFDLFFFTDLFIFRESELKTAWGGSGQGQKERKNLKETPH